MTWSILRRSAVLFAGLSTAPFALAQEVAAELSDPTFAVVLPIVALTCMIPVAIIAIINYSEYRQNYERLATVERLVTAGHTVPPELMVPGEPRLTLVQERRRDVRLGITLLCWAFAVALVFYLMSGAQLRWASWGFLFLIPGLGSFLKAWLTAREMARGAPDGAR
jgi:Domain of unknown function (DUF6249)